MSDKPAHPDADCGVNQDCDCPPELEDPARDFTGDGWHCERCGGELEGLTDAND